MQIVGDPVGGIRKHVHSILFGLDNALFIQSYAYSTTSFDKRFRQDLAKIQTQLAVSTIPLIIRKSSSVSDLVNLWELIKFVKNENVHIVHGHGAKGGVYARLLKRLCGVKALYTPHGGTTHKMFSKWEDWIYTTVEKFVFDLTDYFVFESQYTADSYHEKVGRISNRWMVNYNGIAEVDVEAIKLESRSLDYNSGTNGVIQIGLFGMLRSQKGQAYAIDALKSLVAQGYRVIMHIFGDGPDRSILEQRVKRWGLENNVVFHGDVSYPELHMIAMDVILIPSLFESFGYVALEAMALRKTVIATKVGGLKEIVDDHSGILIEPGNDKDITNALVRCIKNPVIRDELAMNGYQKCKSMFTLDRMLCNLAIKYREISIGNT